MTQARTIVFAGENPLLMLHRIGADDAVAVASLWRCTFAEEGAGYALVLWVDPALLADETPAPTGIYTDNADLARMVWANFSRHFGPFQDRGFEESTPRPARFVEDAGGRRYHRVTCAAGPTTFELLGQDV